MKKYNVGIIGYGGFGKFLRHWWSKLDEIDIVAISDIKGAPDDFENGRFYNNWEDLIHNDKIDIVSIATPPSFHAEMACAAMRANKHVLMEKPIALNNEDARMVRQVQRETGQVIMVDHMLRYNPIIKAFSHLSKKNTFGKLRRVIVENYAQDNSLDKDHWFWNEEVSGGIFIEHGVHFIDLVHAFTDQKYAKVYGCSYNRNEKQKDQVSAMVLYNEGLIASHYHSFSRPGYFEQTKISLIYDLAQVEIEGWVPLKGKLQALVNPKSKQDLALIPNWIKEEETSISDLSDDSRPEGWGAGTASENTNTYSGGLSYDVNAKVTGTFDILQSKSEVYGKCLQEIIHDLVAKIEDPNHKLEVSVDEAMASLEIAVLASK